jgi:hypothetical protein
VTGWLAGAYAVLALGFGWALASGGPWLRRLPIAVAAPPLALGLWLARPDPTGWPTGAAIPAHAALVSAVVREPDPATSDRGRIFLWLDIGSASPRAFAVPYSPSLHRRVQQALARVARRQSVQVRSGRAARKGGNGSTAAGRRLRFVAGRQPRLPEKPGGR